MISVCDFIKTKAMREENSCRSLHVLVIQYETVKFVLQGLHEDQSHRNLSSDVRLGALLHNTWSEHWANFLF